VPARSTTSPAPLPLSPDPTPPRRGAPAWAGLRVEDPLPSARFYEHLLGWSIAQHADGLVAHAGGAPVAMLAPGRGWDSGRWFCFFAADRLEDERERVERLGGRILTRPRTTTGIGRSLLTEDPQGAFFGLMEPDQQRPAPTRRTPGALCWVELDTGAPSESAGFYAELFDYATDELATPTGGRYLRLLLDGVPVAGILPLEDGPAAISARWLAYFTVADVRAAVERARAQGGTIVLGPLRSSVGELAIVRDPAGATFCIAAPVSEEETTS